MGFNIAVFSLLKVTVAVRMLLKVRGIGSINNIIRIYGDKYEFY